MKGFIGFHRRLSQVAGLGFRIHGFAVEGFGVPGFGWFGVGGIILLGKGLQWGVSAQDFTRSL